MGTFGIQNDFEEEKKERRSSSSSKICRNKNKNLAPNYKFENEESKNFTESRTIHFQEFKGYDNSKFYFNRSFSPDDSDEEPDENLEFYDAVDHMIFEELEKSMLEENK